MTRIPVRLTEEKATLLATLYGRAVDARAQRPLLGDTMAARTVERIDADFRRTGVTPGLARSVAIRARFLDAWAAEFLAAHERAVVVHLAAGLDTRVWRLDPGPGVEWYDVDYPEVAELRARLFPERAHHHTIGSSVTAPEWFARLPDDRPALVLAEGLSMYLHAEEGYALLRGLTGHFPRGTAAFDAFSTLGIRLQKLNPAVRRAGATLHWGIDDPRSLEREVPGLHCTDAVSALATDDIAELPRSSRVAARLFGSLPVLRRIGVYLRYTF